MRNQEIALMAHLMRRAGFGAARDELEALVEQSYEETVEQLVNPVDRPPADHYLLYRYHPITEVPGGAPLPGQANWLFNMVNTERPLEEKIALFWHHVFATGNAKVDNCNHLLQQISMFREYGMGSYRDLLVQLAKNPAMIFCSTTTRTTATRPTRTGGGSSWSSSPWVWATTRKMTSTSAPEPSPAGP